MLWENQVRAKQNKLISICNNLCAPVEHHFKNLQIKVGWERNQQRIQHCQYALTRSSSLCRSSGIVSLASGSSSSSVLSLTPFLLIIFRRWAILCKIFRCQTVGVCVDGRYKSVNQKKDFSSRCRSDVLFSQRIMNPMEFPWHLLIKRLIKL